MEKVSGGSARRDPSSHFSSLLPVRKLCDPSQVGKMSQPGSDLVPGWHLYVRRPDVSQGRQTIEVKRRAAAFLGAQAWG